MPGAIPQPTAQAVPEAFGRYRAAIQSALREAIDRHQSGVYSTHRYYMGWESQTGESVDASGGKLLRPTLALLSAASVGGTVDQALPIATALEYVHNFSLIHDDLEDRDRFRHHRPTVWVVWGDATAIISGNAMLKVADKTAKGLVERGIPSQLAIQLQHQVVIAYMTMMEGQFLDLWFEGKPDVSIAQYFDMVSRKTGALIEASMRLGAGTATANNDDVNAMADIGRELGVVFQVRDDVLGIWGGANTGKPVGADIVRRKKSLPAIHALNSASGAAKQRLDEIYRNETQNDAGVEDVLEIMDDVNTHLYCQQICERHWSNAKAKLQRIEIADRFRRDLNEIGTYLLERDS